MFAFVQQRIARSRHEADGGSSRCALAANDRLCHRETAKLSPLVLTAEGN